MENPMESQTTTPQLPRDDGRALLWLIFLVGLVLRLIGTTSGLPHEYNISERGYVNAAAAFRNGKGIELFFSSHTLLLLAEHWILQLVRPLVGWLPWPDYFDLAGPPIRPAFTLLGRITNAFLGAATVFPLYRLGRWAWDRKVGLIGALFFALCFADVRESHFGAPDVLATFLLVVGVYFCMRFSETGRSLHYLLAGVFAGLAFSAKLLSWPLFVLILLFHCFAAPQPRWSRRGLGHLVLTYAAAFAAFIACTPQVITNTAAYVRFWRYVAFLGRFGGVDRYEIDSAPRWLFYLKSLNWGFGTVLLVLALGGVILAFVERRRRPLLLVSFPILHFALLISPGRVFMARYGHAAMPFLALTAASCLVFLLAKLAVRRPGWALPATATLLAVAVAQPLYASVRHDLLLGRKDTRTLALEWIEQHVPPGTRIVTEWHCPPISPETYDVQYTGPYGLMDRTVKSGGEPEPRSIDEFRTDGVEYLISSSFTTDHPMLDPREQKRKLAFYDALDRETRLVAEFKPFSGAKPRFIFDQVYGPAIDLSQFERPGPVIKIYQVERPDAMSSKLP